MSKLAGRPVGISDAEWQYAPHVRSWQERIRGDVETHDNLAELEAQKEHLTAKAKRIVICADGTWNVPNVDKSGKATPTNVWLTWQLVKDLDSSGMAQLKYYHAGVGSAGDWLKRVWDGAVGGGLEWNMLDCYRFLVEHYNPGDHVYLFGFSRGAYTVRTLAGMIRNVGIVSRDKVPDDAARRKVVDSAYRMYRDGSPETTPIAVRAVNFRDDYSWNDFRIACIGVWDTVGARGIPAEKHSIPALYNNFRYGFHDVTLSAFVDCAFHAMAVDERRGPFRATLWTQQPHAKAGGQMLEQRWFRGVHSDVGGGNSLQNRGIANLALSWMAERVQSTCKLELDDARLQASIDPAAQYQITDSLTFIYRALNRLRLTKPFDRVIDGGLGDKGARDLERLTDEILHDMSAYIKGDDPSNIQDFRRRDSQWQIRKAQLADPDWGRDRRAIVTSA